MHVVGLQFDVSWEDPQRNFAAVDRLLETSPPPEGALLVLPEMFATGFTMNAALALETCGATEAYLHDLALRWSCHVCGGLVGPGSAGLPRNQALLIGPDGSGRGRYSKLHPFSPAGEHKAYEAGEDIFVIPAGDLRIAPLICYDLRFPEVFRLALRDGAEVFCVLANWPASRSDHWRALLHARAIENQAYVVGVNRIGSDPNVEYEGGSVVFGPRGECLTECGPDEGLLIADLDISALRSWREEFPVMRDRRDDLLR